MISVIMGVYNGEKTVERAVSSVLNQSFTDLELIICNDGSTDNTIKILKRLSVSDGRITFLHSDKNEGAAAARNHCIQVSTGEYIAIMDADDDCSPSRLANQIAFLEQYPEYDFVGTKGRYFTDNFNKQLNDYWYCSKPQKEDFLMTLPFVHASILFRRSVLISVEGYKTDRKYIRSEDYELLMRLYANCFKGANIEEPLYYIREDQNTYKRRKYRYRFNECIVKLEGFKALGMMPKGILYGIKPLLMGLVPVAFLNMIKERYYKDK